MLSDFGRNLAGSHLVDCLNADDTFTQPLGRETLFELFEAIASMKTVPPTQPIYTGASEVKGHSITALNGGDVKGMAASYDGTAAPMSARVSKEAPCKRIVMRGSGRST